MPTNGNGRGKGGLYRFIWGEEVEFGDCLFYSILTIVLLGLIWLFTFERIGIPVAYSLIPWVAIVMLIWRQYFRTHPERWKARKAKKE